MMGFGAMGPGAWLMGVLAMVAVWGGVWWILSVVVFHWPARSPQLPPASAHEESDSTSSPDWEQPVFPPAAGVETEESRAATPSRRHPITAPRHESDLR